MKHGGEEVTGLPVPEARAELSPECLAALFPDYPPETICVECGRRFDDESQCHEIWKDDPCYFRPNTDAARLARIRQEVQHLIGLGMEPDEIANAVMQTAIVLGKDPRE